MALVSEDRIVEEMFLSPRVIDAATFEELAGSLRTLAQHALEQQALLSNTLKQADLQRASVDASLAKLQASLAPAARLVPTLDEKISQAQQAAQRLTDPQALLGPTLESVTQAATRRCADAVREQSEVFEAERSRLDEVCRTLVDAQVDRLEMMVADLEERAARAEQRLVSAEGVLSRGVQAAEASAETMVSKSVRSRVDQAVEQALSTAISSTLEPMVEAAQSRITQSVGDSLEAIAAASKQAQRIGDECIASASNLEASTQTTLAELTEGMERELERARCEIVQATRTLPEQLEEHRLEAARQADELHAALLARLNATGVHSTQLSDRVEDSLTGLEARAASIANRLAGRIDDLAADADMLAQDTRRRVEAAGTQAQSDTKSDTKSETQSDTKSETKCTRASTPEDELKNPSPASQASRADPKKKAPKTSPKTSPKIAKTSPPKRRVSKKPQSVKIVSLDAKAPTDKSGSGKRAATKPPAHASVKDEKPARTARG